MKVLGTNKQKLLEQVKRVEKQMPKEEFFNKLQELLKCYSDLSVEDFKGIIDDYDEFAITLRDPEETALWNRIVVSSKKSQEEILSELRGIEDYKLFSSTTDKMIEEIQNALRLVGEYERKYPDGFKIEDVKGKRDTLNAQSDAIKKEIRIRESIIKEQTDWTFLNKEDYAAMQSYKKSHPNSAYLNDLEDAMWEYTRVHMTTDNLKCFLDDWRPYGNHIEMAESYFKAFDEWDKVWEKEDIVEIARLMKTNSELPLLDDINEKFDEFRSKQ